MKWFYIIAAALVLALTASPFLLLSQEKVISSAQPNWIIAYSSYGAKVRSLDPATAGDTMSAVVQGNFYESLYGYHYLKRPVEVIPVLAESMPEISDDGLTYTIRIKKGVKYCRNACFGLEPNGTPKTRTVRAEDFVLAFKRIADFNIITPMSLAFIEDKVAGLADYRDRTRAYPKGDFSRYDLPFEGIKAIDEHTLQIRLTTKFPQLLYVLAIANYAPIPREVIDYYLAGQGKTPMADRSPVINDYRATVGTGAYFLAKYVDGGDIILQRNPDFRRETYPTEGGPGDAEAGLLKDAGKTIPFVDVNVMMYVPEDNTAWSLFVSKQTDISGIPRQVFHMAVSPSSGLTDELAKQGIRLVKYGDPAIYWYAFNMEDSVLGKSKSLRQALCLAFDVETYIKVLFNGRGRRAVNTIPSDFPGHDELLASQYAKYDLAAAKDKLQDARKELEAAGILKPGDAWPTFTLDLGGRDEEDRRIGEFAQQQFRQLGLTLKIELNDWPTLQQKAENKLCQIYAMGWHADYPDPENFLQLYYTPNIPRGTNNTNYSNPKFDELYKPAALMLPSPQRTELYRRMVEMLNEDCPIILLTEPVSFILVQPWVYNVKPHPIGYGMYKYRRIDVQQRAAAGGR